MNGPHTNAPTASPPRDLRGRNELAADGSVRWYGRGRRYQGTNRRAGDAMYVVDDR